MVAVFFWLFFCVIVAIAAGSRGRSSGGWFLLSVFISPLLGLILVLVLPNLRQEDSLRGQSGPFQPDGVHSGTPYRVMTDGTIDAIMQGMIVRFANMDRLSEAVGRERPPTLPGSTSSIPNTASLEAGGGEQLRTPHSSSGYIPITASPSSVPNTASPSLGTKVAGAVIIVIGLAFFLYAVVYSAREQLSVADSPPPQQSPSLTSAALPMATASNSDQWREDNPPPRWPSFSIVPGKPRTPHRSEREVFTLATNVEARWKAFQGNPKNHRPTLKQSQEALDALLTIDPQSARYGEAWARFVRLSKIDQEIGSIEIPR